MDLAYFFDTDWVGITGSVADALVAGLNQWKRDYPHSYLVADDRGAELLIDDRRRGWPRRQHRLTGWQAASYLGLARPRKAAALHTHLAKTGHHVGAASLEQWLDASMADGLVFRDATTWVALATRGAPQRIAEDES